MVFVDGHTLAIPKVILNSWVRVGRGLHTHSSSTPTVLRTLSRRRHIDGGDIRCWFTDQHFDSDKTYDPTVDNSTLCVLRLLTSPPSLAVLETYITGDTEWKLSFLVAK